MLHRILSIKAARQNARPKHIAPIVAQNRKPPVHRKEEQRNPCQQREKLERVKHLFRAFGNPRPFLFHRKMRLMHLVHHLGHPVGVYVLGLHCPPRYAAKPAFDTAERFKRERDWQPTAQAHRDRKCQMQESHEHKKDQIDCHRLYAQGFDGLVIGIQQFLDHRKGSHQILRACIQPPKDRKKQQRQSRGKDQPHAYKSRKADGSAQDFLDVHGVLPLISVDWFQAGFGHRHTLAKQPKAGP
mmetsp:Transcript_29336/g.57077  ORF Transcript_29336/g.57077 Transcript_29336/m.57077 type:complete len:242 (-) Transcript_29336:1632-2357(-)